MEDIWEGKWQRTNDPERRESIEELMSFILVGFGAGLRGEEIPLVSLRGILHFGDKTRLDPGLFIMIPCLEDSKGKPGTDVFVCPFVTTTGAAFCSESR